MNSLRGVEVKVYSRHRASCPARKTASALGCDCPKILQWWRDGKVYRENADTRDGHVATEKAEAMMASFRGVVDGSKAPAATTKTLDDAITFFLSTKTADNVTEKHVAKLRFELGEFAKFALGRGLMGLTDITQEHVLEYRNRLKGAQNTKAKKMFRLIGFFRFCVDMRWIAHSPALTRWVAFEYDTDQKPKSLTDEQYTALLAALPKLNGQTTDAIRATLRSMLTLMRWAGLAIRDAVCIERARFEKNGHEFTKLELRRAKTGHPVYATMRNEVVDVIMAGANPNGRYLYIDAVPEGEKELDALCHAWAIRMKKLGEVAGLTDEHGEALGFTSHWMRHTFVAWALGKDLPTEDVAALLGDSVQIVEKHYSEWIQARSERLNQRMMQALK